MMTGTARIVMLNKSINRSAQQRRSACCWVPVARCAPAPGYALLHLGSAYLDESLAAPHEQSASGVKEPECILG